MIKLIIRLSIVALAAMFPKFKIGYGVLLIIGLSLTSSLFFFGAYADHINGQPFWIVRNMILFGIGSLAIGWILGLALIRQAKGHQAMMEQGLEEYERVQKQNSNTLTDAARNERSWPYASILINIPSDSKKCHETERLKYHKWRKHPIYGIMRRYHSIRATSRFSLVLIHVARELWKLKLFWNKAGI